LFSETFETSSKVNRSNFQPIRFDTNTPIFGPREHFCETVSTNVAVPASPVHVIIFEEGNGNVFEADLHGQRRSLEKRYRLFGP